MTANLRCRYCVKKLGTEKQLRQHISASLACRSKWENELTTSRDPPYSPPRDMSPNPPIPNIFDSETADNNPIESGELQVQFTFLSNSPPPSKRARIEDQDTSAASSTRLPKVRYGEKYEPAARATYGSGNIMFEGWLKEGISQWEPFRSREEWELAKWLVKHIGHGEMNEVLGLDIVSAE